jgi:hypothetical protein
MLKECILFDLVTIFISRCNIDLLHCYETRGMEDEETYRCDYNKQSTFEIVRKYDEDTDKYSYTFFDFHDSDGPTYDKCDIDKAIAIVKEECNKQDVFI